MPGRDGTGPMGMGPMTGGGFGFCAAGGGMGRGFGAGMGRRCGRGNGWGFRGYASFQPSDMSRKDFLARQKEALESRLESVNKEMESL